MSTMDREKFGKEQGEIVNTCSLDNDLVLIRFKFMLRGNEWKIFYHFIKFLKLS